MGDNISVDKMLGNIEPLTLEPEEPEQKEEWRWCPICFIIREKRTNK